MYGYPDEVQEIEYPCSADGSEQPALWHAAPASEPAPLLVALHTWSFDHTQDIDVPAAQWCIRHGWHFVHPDFRGPNDNPAACGSELAVQDVADAVKWARGVAVVDESRVYLVGASGGAHMSLLMAGRHPEIWAGVSAWVPISDLAAWYVHAEAKGLGYAGHIAGSCGGDPTAGGAPAEEARRRSPATHLAAAAGVTLDINAGIRDGHDGSVPIDHSLRAFNLLAREADRLSQAEMDHFVGEAAVPPGLEFVGEDDAYGRKRVLFRRSSSRARVTIFDGDHEIVWPAALRWLAGQKKT